MNNLLLNFVQYYGVSIFASIFFISFIKSDKSLGPDTTKYFNLCVITNIILILSDFGQSYYESLTYPTLIRKFFASTSYSLRVYFFIFFVLLYFRNKTSKQKFFLVLPGILNTIVSYSAFFTKLVFYYTDENIIVRGPLIAVPFITSLLYFGIIVYERLHNRNSNDQYELLLLLLIFVTNSITTVLEMLFRLKGLLTGSIIISIVFYYFFFLSENYSYDQLTGAYVRKRLYEDIKDNKQEFGIIALDLNDLKVINDSLGHEAGDKALHTISNTIINCLPNNAKAYRIGGDEFVIIYRTSDLLNVVKLVDKLKEEIDLTTYSATIGYSIKETNEDFQKAFSRADNDLYQNKIKGKKTR